jgi:hypothetical protein
MWSDFLPFGAFDTDSDPPLNAYPPKDSMARKDHIASGTTL